MEDSKKLILKFEFKDLKFKLSIKGEAQKFEDLLLQVQEKLKKQDPSGDFSQIELTDNQGYAYDLQDEIRDFLENDGLVIIKQKVQSIVQTPSDQVQIVQQGGFQLNTTNQQEQEKQVVQQIQQIPQIQQQQQQVQEVQSEKKLVFKVADDIHLQQIQQEQKSVQQQQEQIQEDESPKEGIVIVMDNSGSMSTQFYNEQFMTRMGAVNAFFSAFADKTLAFEYNHVVQLITFNNKAVQKCDFITDMNEFIKLVDSTNPSGGTALYDALGLAIENLISLKKKYPQIILRIIALTDGEDNQSKIQPQEVAKRVIENQIVLDSFVVGDQSLGLKNLTHASGGKCYKPVEMNQALGLFEIETILSVGLRGEIIQADSKNIDLNVFANKPFDVDGMKAVQPKAFQNKAENAQAVVSKYIQQQNQNNNNNNANNNNTNNNNNNNNQNQKSAANQSGGSQKRIIKELQDIINANDDNVKCFPTADDITNWKVLIKGPKGSNYEEGSFILFVQFPKDYPFKPPKVQFMTPIYHCNINSNGSICLDVLKDSWSPALTVYKVVLSIIQLLIDPNPNDPLNSEVAALMNHEPEDFKKKCRQFTKEKALSTPQEIVQQIHGVTNTMTEEEKEISTEEIRQWLSKF